MSEIIEAKGSVSYDVSNVVFFAAKANTALLSATDLVVDSPFMAEVAGEELRDSKASAKTLGDERASLVSPLNAIVKFINDQYRNPLATFEKAEQIYKQKILAFTMEQERIAAEAKRRADEAARVEAARLAEIQRKQEEEARKAADAAELAFEIQQEALARGDMAAANAAAAEASKHAQASQAAQDEAQATALTAEVVSMPMSVAAPAKVSGVSSSKTIDFEVTDLLALVQHIAQHPELISLLVADQVKLRAQVRATGMNTNLPGVRVFEKRTLSARAA